MEMIALLAMDESRLIGAKNGLPWHIPEDLKRFRAFTTGHVVVMGKNTYYSLPEAVRPLPNRRNIVLSREPIDGVETYTSIPEMREKLKVGNVGKVYIIGGAQIYNTFFQQNLIDTVELTLVSGTHDGDVYVDEFRHNFRLTASQDFEHGTFQTLIRL